MDRFRYYLHGGGLKKHPEGNFILLVDHKNEMKKYEEPGQECNRGHKNTLPVKLWDCPVCTELLREEIKRQEILIEEQTKWIKHWKAEIELVREKIKIQNKALRFYEDESIYKKHSHRPDNLYAHRTIDQDKGHIARQALKDQE